MLKQFRAVLNIFIQSIEEVFLFRYHCIAVAFIAMKDLTKLLDEDLTSGLQQGQREAFDEIFVRYWYKVYQTVYARLKVHEEAEEIVQDLFVAIWEKRNTLVIECLQNYLFAAARKRVLNHMRSNLVREKYHEYFVHFNDFWNSSVDEVIEYEELKNTVETVMSRMPKKTREVFRLNRLEGYTISEISEYLKLPKRTIGYHLTQSLKEFRIHLKDFIMLLLITFLA